MLTREGYMFAVANIVCQRIRDLDIYVKPWPFLVNLRTGQSTSAPLPYTLHRVSAPLGIVFFISRLAVHATFTQPGAMPLSRDAVAIQRRNMSKELNRRWPLAFR